MLVLDRQTTESLLDLDRLIAALAPAMLDLSAGRVSMPPRGMAEVGEQFGFLLAMPVYLPSSDTLVTKLVSLFPHNATGPVPTHQAVLVVFEAATGTPAALMDATYLTAMRTAAGAPRSRCSAHRRYRGAGQGACPCHSVCAGGA